MGKCLYVQVVFAILGVLVFPGAEQRWNSDKPQEMNGSEHTTGLHCFCSLSPLSFPLFLQGIMFYKNKYKPDLLK